MLVQPRGYSTRPPLECDLAQMLSTCNFTIGCVHFLSTSFTSSNSGNEIGADSGNSSLIAFSTSSSFMQLSMVQPPSFFMITLLGFSTGSSFLSGFDRRFKPFSCPLVLLPYRLRLYTVSALLLHPTLVEAFFAELGILFIPPMKGAMLSSWALGCLKHSFLSSLVSGQQPQHLPQHLLLLDPK